MTATKTKVPNKGAFPGPRDWNFSLSFWWTQFNPEHLCIPTLSCSVLSISDIRALNKRTTHLFCFQDLKLVGISLPKYAAELAENRGKNRYNNVLPCKLFFSTQSSLFSVTGRRTSNSGGEWDQDAD